MDYLPSYVKLFWKTSSYAINIYILLELIILIIIMYDVYKYVINTRSKKRLFYIRISAYIILLIIISTLTYLQYIKTFSLEFSEIEQVELDVWHQENKVYYPITDLEGKKEIIEILGEYEYRLSWVGTNGYPSSDDLIELRITNVGNRNCTYIVMNTEEIITMYSPASKSEIYVLSEHRELYKYLDNLLDTKEVIER